MADTTGTMIQLVDQDTGGNNNTWGDILDANWVKVATAIAAQASIAVTGGTDALTADQQRNSFIKFTGTLASAETVQVSSIKQFIIENATTGSYDLTVEVSGGAAVTVPQGETMAIRADGTDAILIKTFDRDHITEMVYSYAGAAGGTVNARTITLDSYTGTSLVDGMVVRFTVPATNTGNVTLNLNSISTTSLVYANGDEVAAGGLPQDQYIEATYDGTLSKWVVGDSVAMQFASEVQSIAVPAAKTSYHLIDTGNNGQLIPIDASSGDVWVDLPAVATAGDGFRVGIIALDVSNTITVDAISSELINGSSTARTIDRQYDVYWFKCDGTEWFIESAHEPANEARLDTLESRYETFIMACSPIDEDLTTGTHVAYFTMPFDFTVTHVFCDVSVAPTGSAITVDINDGGGSILSTKLTIDVSETSSRSAATAAVISDSTILAGYRVSVDIDAVGSTVAGQNLTVTVAGNYT